MSFWDFFKKGNEPQGSRSVRRLSSKLMNKWIDAAERYNAMDRLLEMDTEESYDAVLKRFTFLIENTIKDNDEKQYLYERIKEKERAMIDALIRYCKREDEISWPLRALGKLVGDDDLTDILIELLSDLDPIYSRHNDKKVVLLEMMKARPGIKVFKAVESFLEDTDDDVRIKAIEAVTHERNMTHLQDRLIRMLIEEADRPRIQRKAAEELMRLEWPVKGFHDAVETALPEGFFLDKKHKIKQKS